MNDLFLFPHPGCSGPVSSAQAQPQPRAQTAGCRVLRSLRPQPGPSDQLAPAFVLWTLSSRPHTCSGTPTSSCILISRISWPALQNAVSHHISNVSVSTPLQHSLSFSLPACIQREFFLQLGEVILILKAAQWTLTSILCAQPCSSPTELQPHFAGLPFAKLILPWALS